MQMRIELHERLMEGGAQRTLACGWMWDCFTTDAILLLLSLMRCRGQCIHASCKIYEIPC